MATDIESLSETTFAAIAKEDPNNRVEVEVGDSKQEEFYPQVKLMRWGNEVNFSARLIEDEDPAAEAIIIAKNAPVSAMDIDARIVSAESSKEPIIEEKAGDFPLATIDPVEEPDEKQAVEWQKGNLTSRFYDLDDESFEFEIEFAQQPKSNILQFSLEYKNLKFYKQIIPEKLVGIAKYRREDVEGSYAVYHSAPPLNIEGGTVYGNGKAFHIYRPKIFDANGEWVWGDIDIDEKAKLMTVEIPQKFLDNAAYPVIVDPNYGYDAVGSTQFPCRSGYLNYYKLYDAVTASGVVNSMRFYYEMEGDSFHVKHVLYDNSKNRVSNSISAEAEVTGTGWKTINYSAPLPLVTAQRYSLASISDLEYDEMEGDTAYVVGDNTETGEEWQDEGLDYSSPPATISFANLNYYNLSAYMSVTQADTRTKSCSAKANIKGALFDTTKTCQAKANIRAPWWKPNKIYVSAADFLASYKTSVVAKGSTPNPATTSYESSDGVNGHPTDVYTGGDNSTKNDVYVAIVDESAPFRFNAEFEGVDNANYVHSVKFIGYYAGTSGHIVSLRQWNYDTSAWDYVQGEVHSIPSHPGAIDQQFTFAEQDIVLIPLLTDSKYYSNGQTKLELYHIFGQSTSHKLFVNEFTLTRIQTKTVSAKAAVKNTVAKTVSAKAWVSSYITREKTVSAKARAKVIGTVKTVTAQARLLFGRTKTTTAQARVLIIGTTKTVTAKARVKIVGTVQTVTAQARALLAQTKTVSAQARVLNSIAKTVSAKARVMLETAKTSSAKARVKKVSQESTVEAQASVIIPQQKTVSAKATVHRTGVTRTVSAKAKVGFHGEQTVDAQARIKKVQSATVSAKAHILVIHPETKTSSALARIKKLLAKTLAAKARVAQHTAKTVSARAEIKHVFSRTASAKARIEKTQHKTVKAKARIWSERLELRLPLSIKHDTNDITDIKLAMNETDITQDASRTKVVMDYDMRD